MYGATSGSGNYGVHGYNSSSGPGVYGSSASGYAGEFNTGGVNIQGTNCLYFAGTSYKCGSSDERLKKNITPMADALAQILKLRGVSYEWKDPKSIGPNQEGPHGGFIAQEVEKVAPEWVGETAGGTKTLVIPPDDMFARIVESFRSQQAEISALKEEVEELKSARRPVVSYNPTSVFIGFGLVSVAGALVYYGRRKREEEKRS